MNPSSDAPPASLGVSPSEHRQDPSDSASGWQTALDALITSRIGLIKLESQDAAARTCRKLIFLVVAALAALFAWGFIVTGLIHVIHFFKDWPMHWIVLGAGLIHLLVALIFAALAKSSSSPTFSVTRAEFQKDREWLHQLLKTKKSVD